MNCTTLIKKQINKKKGTRARAKPAGLVLPLRLGERNSPARPPAMRRGLHNSRVQGGGAMVATLPSGFWRAKGGWQMRPSTGRWATINIQNMDKRRVGSKSSAFTFTQRCSLQQPPLLPTVPPAAAAPPPRPAFRHRIRTAQPTGLPPGRRGSGEALPTPPPPPVLARSESATVKGS